MPWVQATTDHIPLIQQNFNQLREQQAFRYVSYLADPGILDFHAQRIIQTLEDPTGHHSLMVFLADERVQAVAGISPSPWHSRHFGVSYYKIQPFYCFMEDEPLIEALVRELRNCLDEPDSVYAIRAEARQYALVYHLVRHGFTHVGTSLRMDLPLNKSIIDTTPGPSYDTFSIRDFRDTDLPRLQNIIRRSHKHSHFFCEVRFPPERVRDLFAEWIQKSAQGLAHKILVAEFEGEVGGFCSLFLNPALRPYIRKSIGIIDFIVVDERLQGKGGGKKLLQSTFAALQGQAEGIELRTMADNLEALRFYEKNGFQVLSADQHLHYWTAPADGEKKNVNV
ncbi:MAG: N-acetyltransferase family protein [bacterium]